MTPPTYISLHLGDNNNKVRSCPPLVTIDLFLKIRTNSLLTDEHVSPRKPMRGRGEKRATFHVAREMSPIPSGGEFSGEMGDR